MPWAHLDIAGTAWDNGKPYAGRGGSGWGVHTLVALARRLAAEPPRAEHYIPRRASTWGTVRSRILTSVQSDQFAT